MGLTGKGLADFGKSNVGTPYFYGAKIQEGVLTENKMAVMHRMYPSVVTSSYMAKARNRNQVEKVNVDCSGLIYGYRGRNLGSYQLYATAYTRLPIAKWQRFAVGTVLWKSGHVGIYLGNEVVAEAKGLNYGTIISKVSANNWKYGLTFSEIDYSYTDNLASAATWKGANPYTEPTRLLKKGSKGNDVKWLQWELMEAGFHVPFVYGGKTYKAVSVDGDFGSITDAAVRAFQESCKIALDNAIEVDGKCGPITRKYLKAN